ncbi:MAG: hypothetical protein RMK29_01925 [Myxococcales bacterium]|nr:hypothetical protein [Myxococcota bacterium]MDW8280439.1 hypothetical protein [Myxococcales bacterium]
MMRAHALCHAALWLGLLGAGGASGEPPRGEMPTRPLSRQAAAAMVQAFLTANNVRPGPGLSARNLGGIDVGGQRIYFEYLPEAGMLRTLAVVYCFRRPPRPGLLDGFRQQEQAGTDTGGGNVLYLPDSRCLYLSRSYARQVPPAQFVEETRRLLAASQLWSEQVVGQVSTQVLQLGKGGPGAAR